MKKTTSLGLLLSVLLTSYAHAQKPSAPTPVIVAKVEEKIFSDEVEALGTLRANESVDLTSTVTELITNINFEDGQTVKKGDILVEMDAAEELAELSEQQSFLEEAQRQVTRLEPLIKKGAASESALDESRREVLAINARIQAIRSRLDKRIVKAPYDGVLGLRNISVGALVQPGTLLTTIDDIGKMKLDFSVPEVFLPFLKQGVEIEAYSKAYPDKIFKGTILSVDSRIDPATRSIQARAVIDNSDHALKPGLLMQLELQKNPRKALVIPEESLIADGSDNFALVIIENETGLTAERRKVNVGARRFGEAEITEGLSKGEKIITHGTLRVRPGAALTIRATEKDNESLTDLLNQNQQKMTGDQ